MIPALAGLHAWCRSVGFALVVTLPSEQVSAGGRSLPSVTANSDVIIEIARDDLYEHASPRAGEADLRVLYHRFGPKATITCAFQGHYRRFVDIRPG